MSTGTSSTLVNIAENAEIRLIELLSTEAYSKAFVQDCETCIANAQASALIRTILSDEGALSSLWKIPTPSDGVSAFALLLALLDRVEDSEEESALAMELAKKFVNMAGNVEEEDSKRIVGMLCFLYNLRSDGLEKCRLLTQIVTLASTNCSDLLLEEANGELGSLLLPETIQSNMNDWNVDANEKRCLLEALARAMETIGKLAEKQRFWLLVLETFSEDSLDTILKNDMAIEVAQNATIGAIQDPIALFTEQRGMLDLPAVKALKETSNESQTQLYNLLSIFLSGKLNDFFAFQKQYPSALSQYDISEENATKNIRILSLCSLAAEHNEIPYDVIASTLGIDSSEVESWVITACASGLLVAKMDQLQQVVMVEKCVVRQFGLEQWKVLQVRLNGWKKNVKAVLDGLNNSQLKEVVA